MSHAAMGQRPPVTWMQVFLDEPLGYYGREAVGEGPDTLKAREW